MQDVNLNQGGVMLLCEFYVNAKCDTKTNFNTHVEYFTKRYWMFSDSDCLSIQM